MLYRGEVDGEVFHFGKASLEAAQKAGLVSSVFHDRVFFLSTVTKEGVVCALVNTSPLPRCSKCGQVHWPELHWPDPPSATAGESQG
jgi:hypothetical protein